MADKPFVPDVSRGLKRLQTELDDKRDMLAALAAISELGGIEGIRAGLRTDVEALQAARLEEQQALDALVAEAEAAREKVSTIERGGITLAERTAAECTAKLKDADAEAERVTAQAQLDADHTLRAARDAADHVVETAKATGRTLDEQNAAKADALAETEAKLATAIDQLQQAEAARKRVLKALNG